MARQHSPGWMSPILSRVESTRSTYFSNPRALEHPSYKVPIKEITVVTTPKTGLEALLRPEDSILVLIDHQPYQFANLHSHEPTMIINNVIALAKLARVFNVPTILTSVIEERWWVSDQGSPGCLSGTEADQPYLHQYL